MHSCNSNDKLRVQTLCMNYERQIKVPLNLTFLQWSKDKTEKTEKKTDFNLKSFKNQYLTLIRTAFPI